MFLTTLASSGVSVKNKTIIGLKLLWGYLFFQRTIVKNKTIIGLKLNNKSLSPVISNELKIRL